MTAHLLAMVRAVVDGVEVVTGDDDGSLVETRLPKGMFAAMVQAARAETPAAPEIPVRLCDHGYAICAPCDFIPPSWKPQL